MNSMNSKTTIVGLVAAVAVLSGAMGLSVTGAFSDLKVAEYVPGAAGMLIGHLEVEAYHADGELFAYRQLDNAVVDDGEQCILKMLFATSGAGGDGTGLADGRGEYTSSEGALASNDAAAAADTPCTGVLTGAWDIIGIGTGAVAATDTDVVLGGEILLYDGDRNVATTKTWTNGTGGGNAANTQIVLSKTFTANGGAFGDIAESGLFNSTTPLGSGMLARNVFTAVTINDGDSITITWTFKVGD